MTIVTKNMTCDHTPTLTVRSYAGYECHPEAGTYSGSITTTAGSTSTAYSINDRYEILYLFDGFTDCGVVNTTLPRTYAPEFGVDVEVNWTSDDSTSGNVKLVAGLTSINTGSIMGLDDDTTYIHRILPAPSTLNQQMSSSFHFTQTNGPAVKSIDSEDPLSFILIREGSSADDDLGGKFKVLNINFKWYEKKEGIRI